MPPKARRIDSELESLPKAKAAFIEPMLLLRAGALPEAAEWLYELLCGRPHNSSSVAFAVMWRWLIGVGKNQNTPVVPTPHNFPSEALQELPQCGVLRPVLEGTVP